MLELMMISSLKNTRAFRDMPCWTSGLFVVFLFCLAPAVVRAEDQTYSSNESEFVEFEEENFPFKVPKDPLWLPPSALIETTKGPFEIRFYREEAPISVANFTYLAQKGIYKGVSFHRYMPNYLIQGGDPTGTRKGGPGWTLPPEIRESLRHVAGTIGWAQLPHRVNLHRRSNGSQFYITHRPAPGLDGSYSVFAQVIRGLDNARRLREGDSITNIKLPKKWKREEAMRKAARREKLGTSQTDDQDMEGEDLGEEFSTQ